MGFGLLLFGYLMLTDVEVGVSIEHQIGFDVLPNVIGFIIMFFALKQLKSFYSAFRRAQISLIPLIAVSGVYLGIEVFSLFGYALSTVSTVLNCMSIVENLLLLIFHLLLLSTATELAREVDLMPLATSLKKANVVSAVYYSMAFLTLLLFPFISGIKVIAPFVNLALYLTLFLKFGSFIYNFITLYRCYMYIGYEGETTLDYYKHPFQKLIEKLKK
jgi:hypothetical protein